MTGKRILIGITGASGSIYAERLIEECLSRYDRVYLIATDPGRLVVKHELGAKESGFSLKEVLFGNVEESYRHKIRVLGINDFFSPVASGSAVPDEMVVLPCSVGSLARIANGLSTNLLDRAADVVLKEKKKLIICPREMPLSSIHLKNMLTLSELGCVIMPPMPAFYQKPKSVSEMVDFVVGRILEHLGFEHELFKKWNARQI